MLVSSNRHLVRARSVTFSDQILTSGYPRPTSSSHRLEIFFRGCFQLRACDIHGFRQSKSVVPGSRRSIPSRSN